MIVDYAGFVPWYHISRYVPLELYPLVFRLELDSLPMFSCRRQMEHEQRTKQKGTENARQQAKLMWPRLLLEEGTIDESIRLLFLNLH